MLSILQIKLTEYKSYLGWSSAARTCHSCEMQYANYSRVGNKIVVAMVTRRLYFRHGEYDDAIRALDTKALLKCQLVRTQVTNRRC